MRTRSTFQHVRTLIGVAAYAAMAATALAAGQPAASQQPTKEQREQMATLHERMAACLRSSKTMDECRTEMQKNCKELMGEQACSSMHERMHHNRAEEEKKAQPD